MRRGNLSAYAAVSTAAISAGSAARLNGETNYSLKDSEAKLNPKLESEHFPHADEDWKSISQQKEMKTGLSGAKTQRPHNTFQLQWRII